MMLLYRLMDLKNVAYQEGYFCYILYRFYMVMVCSIKKSIVPQLYKMPVFYFIHKVADMWYFSPETRALSVKYPRKSIVCLYSAWQYCKPFYFCEFAISSAKISSTQKYREICKFQKLYFWALMHRKSILDIMRGQNQVKVPKGHQVQIFKCIFELLCTN